MFVVKEVEDMIDKDLKRNEIIKIKNYSEINENKEIRKQINKDIKIRELIIIKILNRRICFLKN